jgi:hypothetical protein
MAVAQPMPASTDNTPPAVSIGGPSPVKAIDGNTLRMLGQELNKLFSQYASDRQLTELKYLQNLRQYLGIYDPEIESQLAPQRSRAYPRLTRVKCISVLSRLMNLMFPGNERNWALGASPSPEMAPEDVQAAVQQLVQSRQQQGLDSAVGPEIVDMAVQQLADSRAEQLTKLIDDQLEELGGDQTLDYVLLNRKVIDSGIKFGLGLLEGPFVRTEQKCGWAYQSQSGQFTPTVVTCYKPQFNFVPVWDFYPDMSARMLPGEGYFIRKIMGRSQLRKLADRSDFFGDQIKQYLATNQGRGNYKPRAFETQLRTLGTKANVSDTPIDPQGKYEVIVWKGPVSAGKLMELGVEIGDAKKADDVEAEVWLIDGTVIKADLNPWRKLGLEVQTAHCFVFDENDSSPIGDGLPNIVRDSALSVAAATRMALDNASVVCGPNLELTMSLLRQDQDLKTVEGYKIWYRNDDEDAATAAYPAVREVKIDAHLPELQGLVEMFSKFADAETFVGPATGGDMQQMPSEPMRTAAGASMVRGDAALPFKDIVRNFDFFTQSVILSLVHFNKKFNPALAPEGDYNVVARGATSLIAKEVRGMQLDQLVQTLTPEEHDWIDMGKLTKARLASRDLSSILVSDAQAQQNKDAREAAMAEQQKQATDTANATVRELLARAYKEITQGQKNASAADADTANSVIQILEHGQTSDDNANDAQGAGSAAGK